MLQSRCVSPLFILQLSSLRVFILFADVSWTLLHGYMGYNLWDIQPHSFLPSHHQDPHRQWGSMGGGHTTVVEQVTVHFSLCICVLRAAADCTLIGNSSETPPSLQLVQGSRGFAFQSTLPIVSHRSSCSRAMTQKYVNLYDNTDRSHEQLFQLEYMYPRWTQ
jgi:hypothetical protein